MVEIKNMLQLQATCSNIVKEALEEIIEEYNLWDWFKNYKKHKY